ncbi:MAG: glycosyltransferase family 2 protein [bacterium]|nr:MAG: glycosyltransferase family 2 protein [bacterium]
MKLSVVLATRNEAENIARCLKSVKKIADEIIVFDEHSTDDTKRIAESYGAKVYLEKHNDIFHITKQKALEKATGEWILQLDADEVVTRELSKEILDIVNNRPTTNSSPQNKLFIKHQQLIEERDGKIGKDTGEVVGYFVPRRNMFLGKPLIHAGVYPDGVIRLVKNGYAKFPCKSVHEQIELNGRVGWLNESLLHYDSPTLKRYFARLNRYTDLQKNELVREKVNKGLSGFTNYVFFKPTYTFLNLYFRHKGILDGTNGFLWSLFSSWHFPIAYFKYVTDNKLEKV